MARRRIRLRMSADTITWHRDLQFEQMVFGGGGTRCFWQGGFLNVVRDRLRSEPLRVCGVSGGALAAAAYISRRGHQLLESMCEAFAAEDHNVTWHDLVDDSGITPHQRVFRAMVTDVIGAHAMAAVADGPAFQVLLAVPRWGSSRAATLLPTMLYELDLHLRSTPHLRWAEACGLKSVLVDAREVARQGRLADLICAAAAVPPFFDPPRWDGNPVVDAGMIDQAPSPCPDQGTTLILLTRRYRRVPNSPDRIYVRPSRETPADKLDFTDPLKLRRTWQLGESDGEKMLKQWAHHS